MKIFKKDAAKQLGVSTRTIARWIEDGKLEHNLDESGQPYLTQEHVDNYIRAQLDKQNPDREPIEIPYVGDIIESLPSGLDDDQIKYRTVKTLSLHLLETATVIEDPIAKTYLDAVRTGIVEINFDNLSMDDFEETLAYLMIDLNYRLKRADHSESQVDATDFRFWQSYYTLTDQLEDGDYAISTYEELKQASLAKTDQETAKNMLRNLRTQLIQAVLREVKDSRREELRVYMHGLTDQLLSLNWVQFKTVIYNLIHAIRKDTDDRSTTAD